MPYAPSQTGMPLDPGRAPPQGSAVPVPEAPGAARRARAGRSPLANASASDSPQQATG
jgi:hypothetical protein